MAQNTRKVGHAICMRYRMSEKIPLCYTFGQSFNHFIILVTASRYRLGASRYSAYGRYEIYVIQLNSDYSIRWLCGTPSFRTQSKKKWLKRDRMSRKKEGEKRECIRFKSDCVCVFVRRMRFSVADVFNIARVRRSSGKSCQVRIVP